MYYIMIISFVISELAGATKLNGNGFLEGFKDDPPVPKGNGIPIQYMNLSIY